MNDASTGSAAAPPPPGEPNRAPSDLTREYATDKIRVLWYASRCIHSAECVRALPAVFNPGRRPWVLIDAATAEAVANAVARCPTGALQFERLDGGPGEDVPATLQITVARDGPYYVRGKVEVLGDDGRVLRRDTRVALCRCGQSRHLPYCDNTHRTIGFRG
jgi:uncharacterized Fe-S cluster protein YjdI